MSTREVRQTFRVVLTALVLTSTLARGAEVLTGAHLVLRDKPDRPAQRTLTLVSTDATLTLGGLNGSADDPVLHGGSLRVVSSDGDVFDTTYDLPASGWHYVGRKGKNKGYVFRGHDAITSVVVKPGKLLRAQGRGRHLAHSLAASPDPVQIVVTLGGAQYCLGFGGTTGFQPGKRYEASGAVAPVWCPLAYRDDASWLCRPGMAENQCYTHSLLTTKVLPDTSTTPETHTGAEDQPYDCFYVYPTVDLTGPVGNHTDLSDVSLMLDPLLSQAVWFNDACRIFAPLYRQITLGTFSAPDAAQYEELAYQDVRAAFHEYLKYHNLGRNLVIMGHSQGTFMATRLLQEEFDDVAPMRDRLIVALLIGGSVAVPTGQAVGGTFQHLPLCRTATETGCVIAYRSYAEGHPPTSGSNTIGGTGMDTACTNPAALGGGEAHFVKTYLPTMTNQPLFNLVPNSGFTTPFVLYENLYAGECVPDETGHSYLEVRVRPGVGDQRVNLIPFDNPVLAPSFLGTHILDYNWALGDLVSLVETKAAQLSPP